MFNERLNMTELIVITSWLREEQKRTNPGSVVTAGDRRVNATSHLDLWLQFLYLLHWENFHSRGKPNILAVKH